MSNFSNIVLTDAQIELLKECVSENNSKIPASSDAKVLFGFGLLDQNKYNPGVGYLLPSGTFHLSSRAAPFLQYLDQKTKQEAKQKRNRRFQNTISVLALLVPFIIFILGYLLEHSAALADVITGFFQ